MARTQTARLAVTPRSALTSRHTVAAVARAAPMRSLVEAAAAAAGLLRSEERLPLARALREAIRAVRLPRPLLLRSAALADRIVRAPDPRATLSTAVAAAAAEVRTTRPLAARPCSVEAVVVPEVASEPAMSRALELLAARRTLTPWVVVVPEARSMVGTEQQAHLAPVLARQAPVEAAVVVRILPALAAELVVLAALRAGAAVAAVEARAPLAGSAAQVAGARSS